MSMNLHLSAYNKTDNTLKNFDLYQTPTDVTLRILKSNNCYLEYCKWIKNIHKDDIPEEVFIYPEGDYLEIEEPIDIIYEYPFERHIKKLDQYLEIYKDYEIVWSMI